MKPIEWNEMTKKQQRKIAWELLNSPRGTYIMSQALHYAIKALKAVEPEIMQERSNIEDMEMLREAYFNFPIMDPEEQSRLVELLKEERNKMVDFLQKETR